MTTLAPNLTSQFTTVPYEPSSRKGTASPNPGYFLHDSGLVVGFTTAAENVDSWTQTGKVDLQLGDTSFGYGIDPAPYVAETRPSAANEDRFTGAELIRS